MPRRPRVSDTSHRASGRAFYAQSHIESCASLGIRIEGPIAIVKPVEVRGMRGSRHILARDADECAGEVRETRCGGLIREDARIERQRQPLPLVRPFQSEGEQQPLAIDLRTQLDADITRNANWRAERIRLW